MATADEIVAKGKTPLGGALVSGLDLVSAGQQITFNLYRKYVYPLDGMVYWIRQLTPTASVVPSFGRAAMIDEAGQGVQIVNGNLLADEIAGGYVVNPPGATHNLYVSIVGPCRAAIGGAVTALPPGAAYQVPAGPKLGVWANSALGGHAFSVVVLLAQPQVPAVPLTLAVAGDLHYSSMTEQRDDAVLDSNTIIFTSPTEIQPFNQTGPDYVYIGSYAGLKFAFASRGYLQQNADLYHYAGQALYSVNETQVVDDPAAFAPELVVSNSLPIWLGMNGYVSPYGGFQCPLRLFPSFLTPVNFQQPFGSVRIIESTGLQAPSRWDGRWSRAELARDRLRIAFYGASNALISDFMDFVIQYITDWTRLIGLSGDLPVIVDEISQQPELKILGQRKAIDFSVTYNQRYARASARQFILGAKVSVVPNLRV